MFAVIESGGKQYKVGLDSQVKLEKLSFPINEKIPFDKVLLISDGDKISIGQPYIKSSQIEGSILKHGRGDKKIIFRYHSKTRYRKKKGARQHYTEVKISKIN